MVDELLVDHSVDIVHGRVRKPQVQGGVERANQTFKGLLFKAMAQQNTDNFYHVMYQVGINKLDVLSIV